MNTVLKRIDLLLASAVLAAGVVSAQTTTQVVCENFNRTVTAERECRVDDKNLPPNIGPTEVIAVLRGGFKAGVSGSGVSMTTNVSSEGSNDGPPPGAFATYTHVVTKSEEGIYSGNFELGVYSAFLGFTYVTINGFQCGTGEQCQYYSTPPTFTFHEGDTISVNLTTLGCNEGSASLGWTAPLPK
jgi:hypothetical protein